MVHLADSRPELRFRPKGCCGKPAWFTRKIQARLKTGREMLEKRRLLKQAGFEDVVGVVERLDR